MFSKDGTWAFIFIFTVHKDQKESTTLTLSGILCTVKLEQYQNLSADMQQEDWLVNIIYGDFHGRYSRRTLHFVCTSVKHWTFTKNCNARQKRPSWLWLKQMSFKFYFILQGKVSLCSGLSCYCCHDILYIFPQSNCTVWL